MPKKEDVILQALIDINHKMDRHYENTDSRLSVIEKVQVKQEENLGEHMRRTELNEQAVDLLKEELRFTKKEDIEPLKRHKTFVEGALKGIGITATVVSFIVGIVKVVAFFTHL